MTVFFDPDACRRVCCHAAHTSRSHSHHRVSPRQHADAFTGSFGSLADFADGLDGLLGLPSPNVWEAIKREHDSAEAFRTSNYNTALDRTPREEYAIAVGGLKAADPGEEERDRRALTEFEGHAVAARAGLQPAEVLALRLYTSPMYARYNAVLRGLARPAAVGDTGTLRGVAGRPKLYGTACTVLAAESDHAR